jgi:beta-xylosidase
MVEEIVFFRAYQMVYAIDNLAPTTSVTGYENGGLDLEMDFRRTTKNIYRKTKEYKESMSSFLTHLMAKVQKRMTRTLSLYVPQTLNYVVPALPTKGVVEILKTNLVPSRSPLLQLHLVNLDNTLF